MRFTASLMVVMTATLLGGCEPTCARTCDKLVECEEVETPRMSSEVCEDSCETQQSLYLEWDDTQLQDAFSTYKQCVRASTCEEIAEGVCYDEDIFLF